MAKLSSQVRGNGPTVLLIHGFPLNQTVWDEFALNLSEFSKVYTLDLPGFGKSDPLPEPYTLENVADIILSWLQENQIQSPIVVGHSLGGYVALALAERNPKAIKGLVLFHSTASADTAEKKENRNKVLDFIERNGVLTFTSNFIPPLFADQKHPAIEQVRQIAMTAPAHTVVSYTIAMRDRPDRTSVLKDFAGKILFIAGAKDPGIPVEAIKSQASLNRDIEVNVISDCAHMGMLESRDETVRILQQFIAEK